MKQFNLTEYRKDPSKKVITRNGKNVRILCTDKKGSPFNVVGLVENCGIETLCTFTSEGMFTSLISEPHKYDLFFAPEKKEGWVIIYKDRNLDRVTSEFIFDSKENAENMGIDTENYITTTKIEWEEQL